MAYVAQQPAWAPVGGNAQPGMMKPLNNNAPISDDYIGVLLRIEGTPDQVVVPLLSSGNCNVDGLRRACANGQAKTALDLGLGNRTELLDGFPGKVREVFIKLGIISTPVQQAAMAQAVTTFSNTPGANPVRPEMQNPGGMGPLPMYEEETKEGSWSSPACCVPITTPSAGISTHPILHTLIHHINTPYLHINLCYQHTFITS